MASIHDVDTNVTEDDLDDAGLRIVNIVGTFDLNRDIDLLELSLEMPNTEYEPESSPFLIYRPPKIPGTVLIPSNGKASLVGCTSKGELFQLGGNLIDTLTEMSDLPHPSEIVVHNVVVQGQFFRKIDLVEIVLFLGIEITEYEPEQFPGVVYRPFDGRTVLIFSSGKFMINGARTYEESLSTADHIFEKLNEAFVSNGN